MTENLLSRDEARDSFFSFLGWGDPTGPAWIILEAEKAPYKNGEEIMNRATRLRSFHPLKSINSHIPEVIANLRFSNAKEDANEEDQSSKTYQPIRDQLLRILPEYSLFRGCHFELMQEGNFLLNAEPLPAFADALPGCDPYQYLGMDTREYSNLVEKRLEKVVATVQFFKPRIVFVLSQTIRSRYPSLIPHPENRNYQAEDPKNSGVRVFTGASPQFISAYHPSYFGRRSGWISDLAKAVQFVSAQELSF